MLSKKTVFIGHGSPIYDAVYNSQNVFTSSGDRFIASWDFDGNQLPFNLKLDFPAYSIAILNDFIVAGCTDGSIHCVSLVQKKIKWSINFFGKPIVKVFFLKQFSYVVATDSESNFFVVDLNGNKKIHFPFGEGKITGVKVLKDSILIGTNSGNLHRIDIAYWNTSILISQDSAIKSIEIDHKNKHLLLGCADGRLHVYSMSFDLLASYPIHYQVVYGLKIIDSMLVSVSMDKSVKIWNLENMKLISKRSEKEGHIRSVNGVFCDLNEKSNHFLTFSDDKSAILWEFD